MINRLMKIVAIKCPTLNHQAAQITSCKLFFLPFWWTRATSSGYGLQHRSSCTWYNQI